jgi:hypothetical protein
VAVSPPASRSPPTSPPSRRRAKAVKQKAADNDPSLDTDDDIDAVA